MFYMQIASQRATIMNLLQEKHLSEIALKLCSRGMVCTAAGIDWGRFQREWDFRAALLPSGAPAAGLFLSQKNSKRKEDSLHSKGTKRDSIADYPGPHLFLPFTGCVSMNLFNDAGKTYSQHDGSLWSSAPILSIRLISGKWLNNLPQLRQVHLLNIYWVHSRCCTLHHSDAYKVNIQAEHSTEALTSTIKVIMMFETEYK